MKRLWIRPTLLLAAACVSAPVQVDPEMGLDLPGEWSSRQSPGGKQEIEWWRRFEEPQLDAVVEEALLRNHDLQAAVARLDAASAEARIAGADLAPQVGLAVSGSRQRQNFIGLPIPGTSGVLSRTFTSLGVAVETSWEIDLWGRIRSGTRAALADQQAAQADLAGAWLSIAGQTARAWFAVTESRQQVRLARTTVESYERNAESVRTRFARGLSPSLDLRLVLSELAAARAFLETRGQQYDRAGRQLEILLGRYPAGLLAGAERLPEVPGEIATGLPADLLRRRPDLVAAERRLGASEERVAEARALLYPRLTLTASGGTTSQELSDLLDGNFRAWNVVANLFQPIFQGGRLRAGVNLADARVRERFEDYANVLLNALGEVESSLAAEEYLARRERELVISSEQAAAALRLAENRYAAGLEDIITVLVSQRRAVEAESAALAVRRQRLDVRVDLHLALGGGLEALEAPPEVAAEPDAEPIAGDEERS